jgi:methylglutaconyl-CoA hydratase
MPDSQLIQTKRSGAQLSVMLNRPEVRNALNPQLISALTGLFRELAADDSLRVILLGGVGSHFCAGADLRWMREMALYSTEQNFADAMALAELFETIDACPQALVCQVQGGAYGGALGLMCCCDYVLAADDCKYAFSEVRLGISPAVIGPYVVARIGPAAARDLFLSGRRFDTTDALRYGLVNRVVTPAVLETAVQQVCDEYLQAAPQALAETKLMLRELAGDPLLHGDVSDRSALRERTATLIARLRGSVEGQTGLAAFFDGQKPPWQQD